MRGLARLALRTVAHFASRALATRIDPVMVAPEPERVWDEAMDGPAPVQPVWDMPMTPQEWADYHRSYCVLIEHEADLRAAFHEADFEAWRVEVMAQ